MKIVPASIKAIADSLNIIPAEQMRSKLYMLADILQARPSYDTEDILMAAFHIKEEDYE